MLAAIICEYNPFHAGHAYMVGEVRRALGADVTVAAVMGGIFSQRGEPYLAPPQTRAAAAIAGGCDLVLELPYPFSAARAADFARAGVEIAAAVGADMLAFGSESGDLAALETRRARLDSAELRARAAALAAADRTLGLTRAAARAYEELYGAEDLAAPNDILAVEYLRALSRLESKIEPLVIPRVGAYHGGKGGYPSASELRRDFAARGIDAFAGRMPDGAFAAFRTAVGAGRCPADAGRLDAALLLRLATLAADRTAKEALAGDRAALERLLAAAPGAHTRAELLERAASKRCTDASLRRAALYALLGTTADEIAAPVAYTRLLAANARGCAALGRVQDGFVLTKPADAGKLRDGGAQFAKTAAAERAFALCLAGKYDYLRTSPHIVRE